MTVLPQKIINLSSQTVQRLTSADPGKRVTDIAKELIENSIDAGATAITIIIESGGYSLIKVIDDGCGIIKECLPDVCRYHATSKIRSWTDIQKSEFYGFRGISLAHFSCISKIIVTSKTKYDDQATCCNYLYNVPISQDKSDMLKSKQGTIVELKDLLYNFPEVRKNRREDSDEEIKVMHMVIKYALIYPQIEYTVYSYTNNSPLKKLETKKFQEPSKVLSLLKIPENDELPFLLVKSNSSDMELRLYLSNYTTRFEYSTRGIYLNSRLISCPPIKAAVDSIYNEFRIKNNIQTTLKPPYFILIKIPKEKIDIKRHYSSKRVTFFDQKKLIDSIASIVRNELVIMEKFKSQENPQGMIYPSVTPKQTLSASTQTQSSTTTMPSSLISQNSQLAKSSSQSTMTSISFKQKPNTRTEITNLTELTTQSPSNSSSDLPSSLFSAVSPQTRPFSRKVISENLRSSAASQIKNSDAAQPKKTVFPQRKHNHSSNSSSSSSSPQHLAKTKAYIQKDEDGNSFPLNDSNILNPTSSSQQYNSSSQNNQYIQVNRKTQPQLSSQQQIIQNQQRRKQSQPQPQPQPQIMQNLQQRRNPPPPMIQNRQQQQHAPQQIPTHYPGLQPEASVEVRKKKQRSSETRSESQPQSQRSQSVLQSSALNSNQQNSHHKNHHHQSTNPQKTQKQQQQQQQTPVQIRDQQQPLQPQQPISFSSNLYIPGRIYINSNNQPVLQIQAPTQMPQKSSQPQHPIIPQHHRTHNIQSQMHVTGSSDGSSNSRKKKKKEKDPDWKG